jgi:IS5 family transposase
VNADAGYVGIEKRKEIAENERLSKVEYRINRKKGELRKREAAIYKEPEKHLEYIGQPQWEREIEYKKSKVRSKAEHIFYIIKGLFGYRKAVDLFANPVGYRTSLGKMHCILLLFSGNCSETEVSEQL